MFTMIFISSVALLVGILGSALIWGFDALRAEEIEHPKRPTGDRAALAQPGQARASLLSADPTR